MGRATAEEMKSRARARLGRQRLEWGLLACLVLAAVILMVVAARAPEAALLSMTAVFFALVVLGLVVVMAFDLWGKRQADLEVLAGGPDRDQVQSSEAFGLVFLAALGLLYMAFGVEAGWRIASQTGDIDDWWSAIFSLAMPGVVMSTVLSDKFRTRQAGAPPKPADELVIHFRRHALVWSFRATLVALAAVYVAGLYDGRLAGAGAPIVFEAAALTAALRYWWLDRAASRG